MMGFWDAVASAGPYMQTICTSVQTDNHTNTSSLNFYRPDARPDAQPTVSKHCRDNDDCQRCTNSDAHTCRYILYCVWIKTAAL